ncbi:hypothetical protein A9Q84_06445 [Halobacteriovorax marinus]|uniref:Elongation factor P hydroxylase n=1 Tax=Halobacteriovorax marinus TaxID=97084 RepID=A0A1Y5FDP9_9BACT|nr:hypothetical protein A9Q84_06445 [Halobacteriovorax marinus]
MNFKIEDIQSIFHQTFRESYKTELIFGADEPFYKAAKRENEEHKLICRSDFFASALHEISHWCVAGNERRKEDDFGYWYNPDGRDLDQQKIFENVEVKPQALEKAFSEACNYPFKVSVDNLSLSDYDSSPFAEKVIEKLTYYRENGFPKRATLFISALEEFYS